MSTHEDQLTALLADRPATHPSELFRDVPDDFWLWANTEGRDQSADLERLLPGLPTPEVQQRWTGKTGLDTQVEGFEIYRFLRGIAEEHLGDLRANGPVVDFGCGWGRVIRYFLRDVDADGLIGSDYNESLLEFSRSSNQWCRFLQNDAEPPLRVEDHSVGFLYAYSVFSHFSERMHELWLDEIRRVMRPGGVVVLTVRPRGYIAHRLRLRTGEVTSRAKIATDMFPDAEQALEAYDAGEYCFSAYDPADPDAWWGESCIPRSYVEQHWGERFDVLDFAAAAGPIKQHAVILRGR